MINTAAIVDARSNDTLCDVTHGVVFVTGIAAPVPSLASVVIVVVVDIVVVVVVASRSRKTFAGFSTGECDTTALLSLVLIVFGTF